MGLLDFLCCICAATVTEVRFVHKIEAQYQYQSCIHGTCMFPMKTLSTVQNPLLSYLSYFLFRTFSWLHISTLDNTPTYMHTNVQIQGTVIPLLYTTVHLYQLLTYLFIAPNIFYHQLFVLLACLLCCLF